MQFLKVLATIQARQLRPSLMLYDLLCNSQTEAMKTLFLSASATTLPKCLNDSRIRMVSAHLSRTCVILPSTATLFAPLIHSIRRVAQSSTKRRRNLAADALRQYFKLFIKLHYGIKNQPYSGRCQHVPCAVCADFRGTEPPLYITVGRCGRIAEACSSVCMLASHLGSRPHPQSVCWRNGVARCIVSRLSCVAVVFTDTSSPSYYIDTSTPSGSLAPELGIGSAPDVMNDLDFSGSARRCAAAGHAMISVYACEGPWLGCQQ